MPPLQPGEISKQEAADLLGWNASVDVPQVGTARFYYNSLTNTVHCIDYLGTELLSFGGAVTSVFGRGGAVLALVTDYSAFYLQLAPAADQTITGSHQLINRGTGQTGPALSSFDTNILDQAFDSASGEVAISAQNLNPSVSAGFSVGVQGIAQGAGALAFWGLASNTVSTQTDFPNAGDFQAFLTATGNTAGGPIGSDGAGLGLPAIGTVMASATGLQGQGNNFGRGTITVNRAVHAAAGINGASGTVTNNYGYDCDLQSVGAVNAVLHSVNQGGTVGNYGILFEGITHNKLGGGYTQVGALAVPSATASTTSNIAVTSGIVEATGGVAGITLSTQSASLVSGQIVTVKKVDSGVGAVTLTDLAAANFDGDSSYVLSDQWQYVTVQWNGSRFNVIGNN